MRGGDRPIDLFTSFYFVMVTLSTVGYGDVSVFRSIYTTSSITSAVQKILDDLSRFRVSFYNNRREQSVI